jgi:hypothetical protein
MQSLKSIEKTSAETQSCLNQLMPENDLFSLPKKQNRLQGSRFFLFQVAL